MAASAEARRRSASARLAPPLPAHYVEATRLLTAHGADPTLPNEDDEASLYRAGRAPAIWDAVGSLLMDAPSVRESPTGGHGRFHVVHAVVDDREIYYLAIRLSEDGPEQGLRRDAIVGAVQSPPRSIDGINPADFIPNEGFGQLLHDVIGRRGREQPGLQREAARLGEGHAFIIDQRTATPAGPVPPEDIFGYFAVADGSVVPGSYRANPNYRLMTDRGLFQLHPELHAALAAELISRS